jgi:hypothetical protein
VEIIKKEPPKEGAEKEKKTQLLVEFDEGDAAKLKVFTKHTGKKKVQILRECLRYCYRAQFGGAE